MQWIKRPLSYLLGQQAEQTACEFLQEQGLTLISRNYRCRTGEIDLVMQESGTWVFVEVKFRQKKDYGQAAEYFDLRKRKKFESAVQHFLHERRLNPSVIDYRIDLLAIDNQDIQWLKSV